MTLSDMSDSLFTAPLVEMHVYYYDAGLKWISHDDDYYYVDLPYNYVYLLECSSFKLHLYSCNTHVATVAATVHVQCCYFVFATYLSLSLNLNSNPLF
jgi:hypothetical protein